MGAASVPLVQHGDPVVDRAHHCGRIGIGLVEMGCGHRCGVDLDGLFGHVRSESEYGSEGPVAGDQFGRFGGE